MICILNNCTDPYFNAATEEYLLKYFSNDCFMLWQNTSSVFVGKHQNTIAEINSEFIESNNIPVIRRLSGGGTVYHDEGNINFSFITHAEKGKAIDFKTYLRPIVDLLKSLNINVEINPRNNLFIGKEKISGTAAHIYKNKVIHHGTLLFNSSKTNLLKALEIESNKYFDKAVKSVKSPVTTISEHLESSMTFDEFRNALKTAIKFHFNSINDHFLTDDEISEISKISKTKYQTWEWNYGYSPSFELRKTVCINSIETEIKIEIKKGKIENIVIPNIEDSELINNIIMGLPYQKKIIQTSLKEKGFEFWSDYLF